MKPDLLNENYIEQMAYAKSKQHTFFECKAVWH